MTDWTSDACTIAIAQMWCVKQQLAGVDDLFEHRLPRVAATEQELVATEHRIGEVLHREHRVFLSVANGWPAFWHDVDIFGAEELGHGGAWETAMAHVDVLEREGVVAKCGYWPIAVSQGDRDLFVIGRKGGNDWGEILWLAGYEVERFGGFAEFLGSMTEYLKRELASCDG